MRRAAGPPPHLAWKTYTRDIYAPAWGSTSHSGMDWYARAIAGILNVRAGIDVLEVGVGTGEPFAVHCASLGAHTFGLDISHDLAVAARDAAAAGGLTLHTASGDAERLPFKDNSFDLVYSVSSTWYFPELRAAVAEMARVARPGGRVVFDVANALHPTQAVTFLSAHSARLARLALHRVGIGRPPGFINWKVRTPGAASAAAKAAGLEYRMKGFLVLLPVALPRLGERVNLAGRVRLTASGMQDVPIARCFGAKVVFVCRKAG